MCSGLMGQGPQVDFESFVQVGRMMEGVQSCLASRSNGTHLALYQNRLLENIKARSSRGLGGGVEGDSKGQPGLRSPHHTQCYTLPMDHVPLGSARN